jgi:hypothetical protein
MMAAAAAPVEGGRVTRILARSPMRLSVLVVLVACSENNFSSIGEPASPGTDTTTPPEATEPDDDTEVPTVPDLVEEPIADAGPDQQVTAADAVILDGTASSDPAGLVPLVYEWSVTSAPNGSAAALDDPTAAQPVLTTDIFGEYVVELTVQNTEGLWDSTPDEVHINADPQEPVADAGVDQVVAPLGDAVLDGTASYDPGGLTPLAYEWTLVSQPPGSTTTLQSTTSATPQFFVDLAGDYVFELTVQNSEGLWDSTPDQVVVTATPLQGFYVQLSWDVGSDLDLHLLEAGGTFFDSPSDCNFCNRNPAWGAAGGTDNPSLDADAIQGFGPETITIEDPSNQIYTIKVHYYGENGNASCSGACAVTTGTVDIYLDGILVDSFVNTLTSDGDVWTVATIDWPAGIVTPIQALGSSPKVDCF